MYVTPSGMLGACAFGSGTQYALERLDNANPNLPCSWSYFDSATGLQVDVVIWNHGVVEVAFTTTTGETVFTLTLDDDIDCTTFFNNRVIPANNGLSSCPIDGSTQAVVSSSP